MTWVERAARSLADTLEAQFGGDGVVAATAAVDASGTAVARGNPGNEESTDLPEDGRFEVGSVTKTMTATVLACLAGDGVLRLDDQVGRWLSAGANGYITLRQLATHSSGLPARPPNLPMGQADPAGPWAGYTFARAEEGLRQATVPRDTGARDAGAPDIGAPDIGAPDIGAPDARDNPWRYSNLGYQLLGLVLARASGRDYPTLMAERLFAPLSMAHSGVGRRGGGVLLPGHADGRETPPWDHPWGAGGVEATIDDLARYARACLFPPPTPLGRAIELAQAPVLRVDDDTEQALGWVAREGGVREHSGGTGGFSACVTLDHGRGRAVAMALSRSGSPATSSRLKQLARLVLAGADPGRASAPEPWPEWRRGAEETVRALLDGRVAQVHARLVAARREKVTVRGLERAWRDATREAGAAEDITIVRHEVAASGAVVADLAIAFSTGVRRLRMVILPTGELGGFTFLPAARAGHPPAAARAPHGTLRLERLRASGRLDPAG